MEPEHTNNEETQHRVDEVISSFDFEEKFHIIQLDIGRMFREYPGAEQLKIIIGAKGSLIKIANLELLDREGVKATKKEEPEIKPDIV